VQYAVIARLFACNKTILGDARQSVNPYTASTMADIQQVFRQAQCVTLNKSYRSTWEIAQFAQRIAPNPDLIAIERHGEPPQVLACASPAEEIATICQWVRDFASSGHNTAAVICRTQRQAERLHGALTAAGAETPLLTAGSTSFARGVMVCTAHMAKGLEFDRVIVPGVTDKNFRTPMDRNLLYVACTRAMHRLTLTFTGSLTPFVTE
jgi:DNA helicase II / ATP-dependent DNA helicase PcrA